MTSWTDITLRPYRYTVDEITIFGNMFKWLNLIQTEKASRSPSQRGLGHEVGETLVWRNLNSLWARTVEKTSANNPTPTASKTNPDTSPI